MSLAKPPVYRERGFNRGLVCIIYNSPSLFIVRLLQVPGDLFPCWFLRAHLWRPGPTGVRLQGSCPVSSWRILSATAGECHYIITAVDILCAELIAFY